MCKTCYSRAMCDLSQTCVEFTISIIKLYNVFFNSDIRLIKHLNETVYRMKIIKTFMQKKIINESVFWRKWRKING
jgi:hypothetical protein